MDDQFVSPHAGSCPAFTNQRGSRGPATHKRRYEHHRGTRRKLWKQFEYNKSAAIVEVHHKQLTVALRASNK